MRAQKKELDKEEKERLQTIPLNQSQDHDHFDLMYSESYYRNKHEEEHAQEHSHSVDPSLIVNPRELKTKWTVRQDTHAFRFWHMFIAANCLYTSLAYPYYTINEFPAVLSLEWSALLLSESCFFTDIVIKFFKQEVDEGGRSMFLPLEELATKYLHSQEFKTDVLAFLPLGLLFGLLDGRLSFFWFIKAIRIGMLNHYLKNRYLLPIINSYIGSLQAECLKNEKLREDKDEDHTYLIHKIYLSNCVKITRLVF